MIHNRLIFGVKINTAAETPSDAINHNNVLIVTMNASSGVFSGCAFFHTLNCDQLTNPATQLPTITKARPI